MARKDVHAARRILAQNVRRLRLARDMSQEDHQALLNVAQGKELKIAMESPISPPPVADRELPAYLSNGVVGLKV